MAEAERLGLTDVDAAHAFGKDRAHLREQGILAFALELGLELVGLVEMVLDRALVAAGDEDHVGDAGSGRLFHRVLNERLVDDRHHLLRARLGDGQEAAAEPGYGEDRFFQLRHQRSLSSSFNCCSSITATPRLRALSSLLPASAPATT